MLVNITYPSGVITISGGLDRKRREKEIKKRWEVIWGRGLSRVCKCIRTANKVIIKDSGSSNDDPRGGREDYKIGQELIQFTKS